MYTKCIHPQEAESYILPGFQHDVYLLSTLPELSDIQDVNYKFATDIDNNTIFQMILFHIITIKSQLLASACVKH